MLLKPLLWLLVAPAAAHAADNLVVNGSMDFSGPGAPTGWTFLVPAGESWRSFENHPSPAGGAYFGIQDLDSFAPRFNVGGITQDIAGLQVGRSYELSFYSMSNHTSLSPSAMQRWVVTFGMPSQNGDDTQTGLSTSASSPAWVKSTMTFTATATVQALTFAAEFLPGSYPEILNLDGVTLTAMPVPEVSSQQLLAAGLVGLAAWKLRRRRPRA